MIRETVDKKIPLYVQGVSLHVELTDLDESGHPALIISFDNTGTGITATDVQNALLEIIDNLDDYIPYSEKGAANGVCPLDSDTRVDVIYMPKKIKGGII